MQEQRRALTAAVTGSALWGLSGTAPQVVVQRYVFPVWGLVTIRMLGASVQGRAQPFARVQAPEPPPAPLHP